MFHTRDATSRRAQVPIAGDGVPSVWGYSRIEALSTGFARQGYYYLGYEKARIFANVTTSSSLAARIKPDGSHAPARYTRYSRAIMVTGSSQPGLEVVCKACGYYTGSWELAGSVTAKCSHLHYVAYGGYSNGRSDRELALGRVED